MAEANHALDITQSASAAQFNRQSDCYGKAHILADTQDVEQGLRGVLPAYGGAALDVATGGGHTALWLARHGWKVTAGDIAPRMLENAQRFCAEAGFRIETRLFPAEEMPFADGSFDLVTVRMGTCHLPGRRGDFIKCLGGRLGAGEAVNRLVENSRCKCGKDATEAAALSTGAGLWDV